MKAVTRNPYAGVSWATWGRHKASYHCHTTQSDGGFSPEVMIDAYVARGYDIIGISDHNGVTWPWSTWGRDPDTLGVVGVPADEIDASGGHRVAVWPGSTPPETSPKLGDVASTGGIFHVAHPGRDAASDPRYIRELLKTHAPTLYAVEVYNKGNQYPQDLPGWDAALTEIIARKVDGTLWGVSADDSHYTNTIGRNYQVFYLPELTGQAVRTAMLAGCYTFTYDPLGSSPARHEGGGNAATVAPVLESVTVTNAAITISASAALSVAWFTSGGVRVADDYTLDLSTAALGTYARAELYGADGAVTHTQPLYLTDTGRRGAIVGFL